MKKEFIFRVVLALGIFFLVYQFGIKPMLGDKISKSARTSSDISAEWVKNFVPSGGDGYDVIVLGEEPDGIAAAVSTARLGAKTLLLSEGKDLGGAIEHSMLTDLEISFGKEGKLLNGGILSDMFKSLGKQFSPSNYQKYVESLVKNEKNIYVKYGVALESPVVKGSWIEELVFSSEGIKTTAKGRFFIDATRNGTLLKAFKATYTTGSGDLNMGDSFMPASLNFMMEGADSSKIEDLVNNKDGSFYKGLSEFYPNSVNTRLDELKVSILEKNKIIIQGLQAENFNATDRQSTETAYKTAVREAENFASFLSERFGAFKGWKLLKAADNFYSRETFHYNGLYRLTVNDILENRYFDDTIAMGSYPVEAGKFVSKGLYLAGKPVQYGIPIGCLIPSGSENLMMTGAKASYASLAASSAGTLGTGIATGQVCGITAIYCLTKQVTPSDVQEDKQLGLVKDIQSLLEKQGFYLPNEKILNKNYSSWTYPALRQLLTLGLIAGGTGNDYSFTKQAVQKDLAVILLNGVYRLNKDSYNLELDSRVRPYFNSQPLTRDKAAEMLAAFYDLSGFGNDAYNKIAKQGYINDMMQLRLKEKKNLTMDDVYYLGAYNIKMYTGKDIKD